MRRNMYVPVVATALGSVFMAGAADATTRYVGESADSPCEWDDDHSSTFYLKL